MGQFSQEISMVGQSREGEGLQDIKEIPKEPYPWKTWQRGQSR